MIFIISRASQSGNSNNSSKQPCNGAIWREELSDSGAFKGYWYIDVSNIEDQPNDHYIQGVGGYEYVIGKGLYIEDETMPHDIFRLGGYPDDKLFSFEDTMAFINTHTTHSSYSIEERDRKLKEYWEQYPDGYIHFG